MKRSEATLFSDWEKGERPYPWKENQFLETMNSETQSTLVREENGEAIGFGVLQMIESEAYLLNLMVRADCRRRGLGEDLMSRLMTWSKDAGANHMFLDVDPANLSAFALYQKCGFRIAGRRPHGYPAGEPSYLMKKEF
jgi:ribosomal-protein-alanine N-acetyltransferase